MIGSWLASHKSLVATATSGTVVAALVATVAVVSGGYTAQRLDLGDASVWVVNETQHAVGRANAEVRELNSVVSLASSNLGVVQDGSSVFAIDRSNSTLEIVDPATSTVSKSVPLPPDRPQLFLGGDRIAIQSPAAGSVWIMPLSAVSDFDAESEPDLRLGAESIASMDSAGTLFSYAPATGDLSRVDVASGDTVTQTDSLPVGAKQASYQLTSVNGSWALFDAGARILRLPTRTVDLSGFVAANDGPVLQRPSVSGTSLFVAFRGGLIEVPVESGEPTLVATADGTPAAPVQEAGCTYAAWADGSAWQRCAGDGPQGTHVQLEGVNRTATLSYRLNGDYVVLNDSRGGRTWAVQKNYALIDNWDALIAAKKDQQVVEENDEDAPEMAEKQQAAPVAVDDEFGARPGRSSVLPVLLNDFDPNGDALVISEFTQVSPDIGHIDLVNNNQQLQLTLQPKAWGTIRFSYTITDGRGGHASADVVVTVRSDDENSPPVQVRSTRAAVKAGGRTTVQVLGDWVDPDGDSFYLTSAAVNGPDAVTFTRDGSVTYANASSPGDVAEVRLIVSDGRAETAGSLRVSVRAPGDVPLVADPFVVLAYAGQEVRVEPLPHVRGGSGDVRLTSVPEKTGVTLVPDYDGGTFRFTSDAVRTNYIDYTVTDGDQTVTGLVRIDVSARPEANTQPITVPHTAFIHQQTSQLVDVLAGDIDPAGGVLLITGTYNVPRSSGLRVEILEQRILRVTLTQPLDGPVSFNYRVSNGLADAEGTVTVIQIPVPTRKQPPVANPDSVSVRVGDAIDIPVLKNDKQPDGDPLTLNPTLERNLPAGSGLLFASGNKLRYLAPNKTGNFTAVYRVDAPDGQWATAEVKIAVREIDEASNNPPVPRTVTARVLAGDTVRIPIPLTGIDPDGDSVQLLGQETSPEKGAVTDVGADWIEYESGQYSEGTDTFSYAVVDSLGARATGTIRVGISARLEGSRNPIAVADEVTVRPGTKVSVRVLENDSNPDGGTLTITSVASTAGETGPTAAIENDLVIVDAPATEGRYGFIYEIQNSRGGTSSNFLTVIVKNDAPLSWPDARDSVLTLSDVLGRTRIDVNVLSNVFFADGPVSSLRLDVLGGYGDRATVTADKRISVVVSDSSQIIPFRVTHPEDSSIVAYAFIWVPGFNDALPQLKRGVPGLKVASESQLTINLNDFVVAVGGKQVRLTNENTVHATHANGDSLVANDSTLLFTSEKGYYGPASISFEVTDGSSATDPTGRKAMLVLPITVTPRENQPPVFTGATLEFEPGQQKVIDLLKLTTYPYQKDMSELVYQVLEPKPVGFTYQLAGQTLTITAGVDTPKGATESMTLGVRDAINEGQAGRVEMRVVASNRPLAAPAADSVIAPRGKMTVLDVLANDEAANPFPEVPLKVVAVRGIGGNSTPAGIAITPSADKSKLTIAVSADAAPVDTHVQYQVADATMSPDRYAWGTVTISVQDVPEPVSDLRVTGFGDRSIDLAWTPGGFNNSPITGYDVTLSQGKTVVQTTTCTATTCTVSTPGNGSANKVSIRVTAKNSIGSSPATALEGAVWSDITPGAPVNVRTAPLDGGLTVAWSAPPMPEAASKIERYIVTVGANSYTVSAGTGTEYSRDFVDASAFANGTPLQVTVSARNQSFPALTVWQSTSATGTPYGAPKPGTLEVNSGNAEKGTVTLSWGGFQPNGDAIVGYYAQLLNSSAVPDGSAACMVSRPAPGTPRPPAGSDSSVQAVPGSRTTAEFTGLTDANRDYYFVVWGYNRAGCVASNVTTIKLRPTPGQVTDVRHGMRWADASHYDDFISSVSPARDRTYIRAVDAAGAVIANSRRELSTSSGVRQQLALPFGTKVSFQISTCNVWGGFELCGPWSETFTAATPSLTFEINLNSKWIRDPAPEPEPDPGPVPDPGAGDGGEDTTPGDEPPVNDPPEPPAKPEPPTTGTAVLDWTAHPANGNKVGTTYACGVVGTDIRGTINGRSCTITNVTEQARYWLDVMPVDANNKPFVDANNNPLKKRYTK